MNMLWQRPKKDPENEQRLTPPSQDEAYREWRARSWLLGLKLLEHQDLTVPGFSIPGDYHLLATLAKCCPEGGRILEIGSFMGKSTRYLLHGATQSNCRVFAVDPCNGFGDTEGAEGRQWDKYIHGNSVAAILLNIRNFTVLESDFDRFELCVGTSERLASKWPHGKIDMVFIDGDHNRCRQDVDAWIPHMMQAGLLVLHDVSANKPYGKYGPAQTARELQMEGWEIVGAINGTVAFSRAREWWHGRIDAEQRDLGAFLGTPGDWSGDPDPRDVPGPGLRDVGAGAGNHRDRHIDPADAGRHGPRPSGDAQAGSPSF